MSIVRREFGNNLGGPWGTGMHGYTSWSEKTGQASMGPTSFRPMTYQAKYGTGQAAAPAAAAPAPIDWASLMQPGGAPQQNPSITTGITARPVYDQQQVNSALSKFSSMAPPKTGGPLGATAASLYGQESGRARLNAGREMAGANAQMLLKTQMGRSQAGLGWGRLANQQNQLADTQQLNQQQMALALLRQALGGF